MQRYIIDCGAEDYLGLREEFAKITARRAEVLLMPGIYFAGGTETECGLCLDFDELILRGEGRAAIYDNRGHMINARPKEGETSSMAQTVLFTGGRITLENIEFVNGCNVDYEFGGRKFPKVSSVITQAYAIGAWGVEELVIRNCSIISVLDTMAFGNVKNLYVENCFIQGNNDFIGTADHTYYRNCRLRLLGSYPMWSAGSRYHVFEGCEFEIQNGGRDLCLTKRGGNLCLLSCCLRGRAGSLKTEVEPKRTTRCYLYNSTLNGERLVFEGCAESFVELTEGQADQFTYENISSLHVDFPEIEEIGENGFTFTYNGSIDSIECSPFLHISLRDGVCTIGNNAAGRDREGYVLVRRGPLETVRYFRVIGRKRVRTEIAEPLSYKISGGRLYIEYLTAGDEDNPDCSHVEVFMEGRLIYRLGSRGSSFPILPSYVGHALELRLTARREDYLPLYAGALATRQITAGDVCYPLLFDAFDTMVLDDSGGLHSGYIRPEYLGEQVENFVRFNIEESLPPFLYGAGTDGAAGERGLLYCGRGGALLFPMQRTDSFQIRFTLAVEKASGAGFGSANGQFMELIVDCCPEKGSGTAFRLEREKSDDKGIFLSVRQYEAGINTRITQKRFSTNFRTECVLSAKLCDGNLDFALWHSGKKDGFTLPFSGEAGGVFVLRSTGTAGIGNRFVVKGLSVFCGSK